jgi:hypothetical protein
MNPGKLIIVIASVMFCEISFSQSFIKITEGEFVNDGGWCYAMCWADFNNDGYQDLFVTNNNSSNQNNMLYLNDAAGGFTKVTSGPVVNDGGSSYGCTAADIDNDGDIDLFVSNYNENNFLYLNNSDGTFTKVITGSIVNDGGKSVGCAFGDYNNDGYLDLYVANRDQVNFFYKNNGDGTFTKITTGEIVTDIANSGGCSWGDYNNDGYIDLFVANATNDCLYKNNGDGTFTKRTDDPVVNESDYSTGGSWGDYDNDGDIDLFVTGGLVGSNYCRLFNNNGDGTFTKITNDPIVNPLFWAGGSAWGDYDNDGDLDMFVGGYDGINRLYTNNDNGTFTAVDTGIVVTDGNYKKGVGWCDYDKDGDMDLFAARNNYFGGNNCFYKNLGVGNNWINITCEGTTSNYCGVGAKVYVRASINGTMKTQLQVITTQSGGNQSGMNNLNPTFGLRDAAVIDSIIIVWPGGITDRIGQTPVNQFIKISEGGGIVSAGREDNPNVLTGYNLSTNYPNPFNPATMIRYSLPAESFVSIKVYNITGKEITTLVNELQTAGEYQITFDGKNLASGVYFLRMSAGEFSSTIKMNLLK